MSTSKPIFMTLRWIVRIATRPTATAACLLDEPRRLRHGVTAWLLMGAMYTVTVGVGYLMGGTGTFEDTFGVVALGSIFPTFVFMWLPETVLMIAFPGMRGQQLGGFAGWPAWAEVIRQLVVPVWTVAIYALAVARVQSISRGRALFLVILGMVPAVAVTLVFVR